MIKSERKREKERKSEREKVLRYMKKVFPKLSNVGMFICPFNINKPNKIVVMVVASFLCNCTCL